jgi:hypothetical protein
MLSERGKFHNEKGKALKLECKECKDGVPFAVRRLCKNYVQECCAIRVLSEEPDFSGQKEWLTEVVCSQPNFQIIFYPKYHCELNYIEMIWCWLKSYFRDHPTSRFPELVAMIPDTIDNVLPISFIRKCARHCYNYMVGYSKGYTGHLLEYAIKTYSSHRKIPWESQDIINQYDKKQQNTKSLLKNIKPETITIDID